MYTFAVKCHYSVRRYDSTDLYFLDCVEKKEAILNALELLEEDENIERVAIIKLPEDEKIAEIKK